MQNSTSSCL